MEPGKNSIYTLSFMLPWQIKFIYGCITDSIPICGSRKKGWIVLLSVLLVITAGLAATIKFDDPSIVVLLLTLSNTANAGMDVVVDGLMVMQAKRDPKMGTQELQSLSKFVESGSMVLSGILGAYLTSFISPYWCFGV